jgi:hypothetical protein
MVLSIGLWAEGDDEALLSALLDSQAKGAHQVKWDELVEGRTKRVVLHRWNQLLKLVRGWHKMEFMDVVWDRYTSMFSWDAGVIEINDG